MKPRIRDSLRALSALLLLPSVPCAAIDGNARSDEYHERLDTRPLDDGKVLSRFEFAMRSFDGSWQGLQYRDGSTCAFTGKLATVKTD